MKKAYSEMLDGYRQNPEQKIWHAIWSMQLNDETGRIVGDLCFKGMNSMVSFKTFNEHPSWKNEKIPGELTIMAVTG